MSSESHEANRHEYTAALRVWSQTLHLADLTDALGEPSSGHDVGDPVSRRPAASHHRHATWVRESGLDRTLPLDAHIEELVVFAEVKREALAALRVDCEMDIFCGLFSGDDAQGGFTIEPTLSARLAELQLPVAIDVY